MYGVVHALMTSRLLIVSYMQVSVATWMTPCIGSWYAKVFDCQDWHTCFSEDADTGVDIADISSSGKLQDGVTGIHHSAGC